eukprot:770589-Prymnesium_polylepis.1
MLSCSVQRSHGNHTVTIHTIRTAIIRTIRTHRTAITRHPTTTQRSHTPSIITQRSHGGVQLLIPTICGQGQRGGGHIVGKSSMGGLVGHTEARDACRMGFLPAERESGGGGGGSSPRDARDGAATAVGCADPTLCGAVGVAAL